MRSLHVTFCVQALLYLALCLYPISAAAEVLGVAGITHDWEGILLVGLSADVTFALLAAFAIMLTILRLGLSNIGIVWGHFLLGVLILAFTHVFVLLAEAGFIEVNAGDVDVWWELIYFMGLLQFFIALHALKYIAARPGEKLSVLGFLGWALLSVLYVVFMFFTPELIEQGFVAHFSDSVLHALGLLHWLAVLASIGMIVFALRLLPLLGETFRQLIFLLTGMFAVLMVFHVWELLVDYYSFFSLSEVAYESIEEGIMLTVAVLMFAAFFQTRRAILASS